MQISSGTSLVKLNKIRIYRLLLVLLQEESDTSNKDNIDDNTSLEDDKVDNSITNLNEK